MSNKYGVYIGGVDKQSVDSLTDAIIKIMYAGAGDNVKIAALSVLEKGVKAPEYTTISGCNMNFHEECCEQEPEEQEGGE